MNIDDMHFDRLVDDEMNEEERRELLGRLDDEPGGWRRCALAFLESQCWRQVLGETRDRRDSLAAVLQSTAKPVDAAPTVPCEPAPRNLWLGRAKVLSAMAASFLAALWLGTAAQRNWSDHRGNGPSPMIAANQQVRPSMTPIESHASPANPWHMVAVSAPSVGRQLQVPAVERDNVDEQWRKSVPPAIPDNVMQALARTGHQIEQQREYMPVPLQDGRQLVVPVDRVNVRYVGNGPY
jgi:hypothetical protein